jgi:subtilase family serine protease
MFLLSIVALLLQLSLTQALYKEAFNSDVWKQQQTQSTNDGEQVVHFTVALSGRNVDQMKQEFLEVSSPKSPTYGAYNTARELHTKYGSSQQDKSTVISYFEKSIEGASVKCVDFSDLCTVRQASARNSIGMCTARAGLRRPRSERWRPFTSTWWMRT